MSPDSNFVFMLLLYNWTALSGFNDPMTPYCRDTKCELYSICSRRLLFICHYFRETISETIMTKCNFVPGDAPLFIESIAEDHLHISVIPRILPEGRPEVTPDYHIQMSNLLNIGF